MKETRGELFARLNIAVPSVVDPTFPRMLIHPVDHPLWCEDFRALTGKDRPLGGWLRYQQQCVPDAKANALELNRRLAASPRGHSESCFCFEHEGAPKTVCYTICGVEAVISWKWDIQCWSGEDNGLESSKHYWKVRYWQPITSRERAEWFASVKRRMAELDSAAKEAMRRR